MATRSSKRKKDNDADIGSLSKGLGMSLEEVQKLMSSGGGEEPSAYPTRTRKPRQPKPSSTDTSSSTSQPRMQGLSATLRSQAQQQSPMDQVASAWSSFIDDVRLKSPEEEDLQTANSITPNGRSNYLLPLYPTQTKAGWLAQSGTLDSSIVGKIPLRKEEERLLIDLEEPTMLCRNLFLPFKVRFIASSASAAHSIAIDTNGNAYAWGRNDFHQCHVALNKVLLYPQRLNSNTKIICASVGKSHSVIIDELGQVYGCGRNHLGQLGSGEFGDVQRGWKGALVHAEHFYNHQKFVSVACGEHFTLLLDDQGLLYSTGSSEYGQLGNGYTGEHIAKANKISFENACEFTRRSDFVAPVREMRTVLLNTEEKLATIPDSKHIRFQKIACGKNHSIAIEANWQSPYPNHVRIFSWGCGNYGCLGHGIQKDEYKPRQMSFFWNTSFLNNAPVEVSCGALQNLVLTEKGHVYYWGRFRAIDESTMRPELVTELANNGHRVTTVACGSTSMFASTDSGATIAWGNGSYAELGYGRIQKKSSVKPIFIQSLDKVIVTKIAAGLGHSLYILQDDDQEDRMALSKVKIVEREDLDRFECVISNAALEERDRKRREEAALAALKKKKPKLNF